MSALVAGALVVNGLALSSPPASTCGNAVTITRLTALTQGHGRRWWSVGRE